jgi:parvulin-like peptidyl-prolyl isomerase
MRLPSPAAALACSAAISGSLLLGACAGPAHDRSLAPGGVPVTAPVRSVAVPAPTLPPLPASAAGDLGPEILLPSTDAGDAPVATLGDLVLRRSDAFARLLMADPKLALSAVDLLVFDVLVARHAEQHGIRVRSDRIEALAQQEEQELREQVQREFGAEFAFSSYIWRIFGMALPDWQQALRLRTARRLYQGYVIRYLGLREDRVVVRYLVNDDSKLVAEAVEKARAGADFATLALRWSEDAHRRDGGLLPPFGRDFPHPVTQSAFQLQRGEVAGPIQVKLGDGTKFLAVYCLDRLPGRNLPFASVEQEIDAELIQRPLSPLETNAYTMRWRGQFEPAPPPSQPSLPTGG